MSAHQGAQDANLTPVPTGVASVPTVDAADVLARHTLAPSGSLLHARICAACYWPWRGDAETGGCEAVLLAKRMIELEALLHAAEGKVLSARDALVRAALPDGEDGGDSVRNQVTAAGNE